MPTKNINSWFELLSSSFRETADILELIWAHSYTGAPDVFMFDSLRGCILVTLREFFIFHLESGHHWDSRLFAPALLNIKFGPWGTQLLLFLTCCTGWMIVLRACTVRVLVSIKFYTSNTQVDLFSIIHIGLCILILVYVPRSWLLVSGRSLSSQS